MKLVSAVILFLILAEVLCQDDDPSDYQNYLMGSHQGERLTSDALNAILRRVTRKPRPKQFVGLMGRRSSRQKLNSFVGLMGKRSQEMPDLYEWGTHENFHQFR